MAVHQLCLHYVNNYTTERFLLPAFHFFVDLSSCSGGIASRDQRRKENKRYLWLSVIFIRRVQSLKSIINFTNCHRTRVDERIGMEERWQRYDRTIAIYSNCHVANLNYTYDHLSNRTIVICISTNSSLVCTRYNRTVIAIDRIVVLKRLSSENSSNSRNWLALRDFL